MIFKTKTIVVFICIFVLCATLPNTTFAWDHNPYSPGSTLNPDCLPTDVNCDVTTFTPSFLSAISPLLYSSTTGMFSMLQSSSTSSGYLSSVDWNIFNNKQNAIATGTADQYLKGDLSLGTFPTTLSSFTNDVNYLTSTIASSTYLTISNASSTYYPLNSNPAGYLTSFTETDPLFTASAASSITSGEVSDLSNLTNKVNNLADSRIDAATSTVRNFLSSISPELVYDPSAGQFSINPANNIPLTASTTNWDTAYSWGNHATAGYLLSSVASSTYAPLSGATFTGNISAPNISGSVSGTFSGTSTGINTGDETQATIKTKLGAASSGVDGYLTGTDWNTFNSKQNNIVTGTISQYFKGDLSLGTFPTALSAFTNDSNFIGSSGAPVQTIFGRQGIVTAQSGDYNSSQVTENTNLYFTNARSIGSNLTGYLSGAGTISSSDSVLSAIQKLNGNIGGLITGVSSVSNSDGTLTISPTGGSVIASLALGHANTWTGQQIFNSSNVGIGTTTPVAKLSIHDNSGLAGTNPLFVISSSTSGNLATTTLFTFLGNGNLGIGTATPGSLLTIQNNTATIKLQSTSDAAAYNSTIESKFSAANPFNLKVKANGTEDTVIATALDNTNHEISPQFGGSAAGTMTFFAGKTERMRIDRGGNVGIGTTSPVAKLSIHDTSGLAGTNPLFTIASSTSGYLATTTLLTFLGNGNLGIGTSTPGQQLTLTGSLRLPESTSTSGIIYLGSSPFIHNYAPAGANADYNTFIGLNSGNFTMTSPSSYMSTYLTVVGAGALAANTTGYLNVAIGSRSMVTNSTGNNNVAIGDQSLINEQTGQNNVAVGNATIGGYGNSSYNTAIGTNALYYNANSTSYNTAVGYSTGPTLSSTNTHSVYLGSNARTSTTGLTNLIVIGDSAVGTQSNQLVLGSTTITQTLLNGNVGIGTTTPAVQLDTTGSVRFELLKGAGANLVVDSLGNVTVSSDERLKNIQGSFTRGLTDLEQINPISFKWKPETGYDTTNTYSGFSAQNVQLAIPEAISTDSKGYLTLADRPIIAALVNAVKEIGSIFVQVVNGVAYLTNIAVQHLTVGSSDKPTGITIYDSGTGQPYCMRVYYGQTQTLAGTCESLPSSLTASVNSSVNTSVTQNTPVVSTTSSTLPTTTVATTTLATTTATSTTILASSTLDVSITSISTVSTSSLPVTVDSASSTPVVTPAVEPVVTPEPVITIPTPVVTDTTSSTTP